MADATHSTRRGIVRLLVSPPSERAGHDRAALEHAEPQALWDVVYSGVPRLRLIASLNHESSRTSQDEAGVLQSLPGFSSVSTKASFAVRSGLDLEVAAANVFDQNYQLYAGYPEPGRIVSVNLRDRF
jgi:outer membrane cobalamin receptor